MPDPARRPVRIQRCRTAGWRMPEGAIYVGRPSRWGNPWSVGLAACACRSVGECQHNAFRAETAAEAVDLFREHLARAPRLMARIRAELPGHDLACWCPLDQPCHADVLLEIANA